MLERRDFKGGCEIRTAANGKPIIAGYAAMFNRWSQNMGGFVEQVDKRAFDKTVQEADVRVMANHDPNWLLGRTSTGTARLSVDSRGLEYEVDVNLSDPDGQRALAKVERGDWDGSSFGFRAIRDDWNFDAAPRERTLLEVSLRDVGPATFPAYLDTPTAARGAARTLAEHLGMEVRDVEAALDAGGFDAILEQRAVWSTAYVDSLPDSSFLYIEPGGEKDGEGKTTPRSLRHFPVKDANGDADLPHVRDALSRIPQSNLPQNVKDEATSKARALLGDEQNSVDFNIDTAWIDVIAGELRAGKVLSAASVSAIMAAIEQLESLVSNAAGLPADADDEQNSANDAEIMERLRSLHLRREIAA